MVEKQPVYTVHQTNNKPKKCLLKVTSLPCKSEEISMKSINITPKQIKMTLHFKKGKKSVSSQQMKIIMDVFKKE